MNNKNRQARFTSSNAHKLIGQGTRAMTDDEIKAHKEKFPKSRVKTTKCPLLFAATGLTYIEEKQIEKRMQTCLDADGAYSQAMAWGNFMEMVVYSKVRPIGAKEKYEILSKETFLHPVYGKFWSGSADMLVKGVKVSEIKCYQKKKFAQYTDLITKPLTKDYTLQDKLADFKEKYAEEYWQIISNACIHNVKKGEAITYMPYESEYEFIVELANNYEGTDLWKYRFITEKPIEQLPFLKDGGYYKDVNKFEFEIPQADIDYLTDRMILAEKLLNKK